MSAQRLYTPPVLAAATRLAGFALTDEFVRRGEARSPSCGSRVEIGLIEGADGRIAQVGIAAHACAIGQASACVFAENAAGQSRAELLAARDAMRQWVREDGPRPDWPALELIDPARAYPGRHAAMLLAWEAAVRAMGQEA